MKSMTVALNGPVKGWDRSGQNGRFHYDTKKNTEIKAAIRYASQATAEELGAFDVFILFVSRLLVFIFVFFLLNFGLCVTIKRIAPFK